MFNLLQQQKNAKFCNVNDELVHCGFAYSLNEMTIMNGGMENGVNTMLATVGTSTSASTAAAVAGAAAAATPFPTPVMMSAFELSAAANAVGGDLYQAIN